MQYRPEIDGLRTLAIAPVILFHAGLMTFKGGYVGVDVFFTISGYLITGILLEDLKIGRFSLVTFYERRFRRILPALFLVVTVTTPFAILWLLPNQLHDFFQSMWGVGLFISNFIFWKQSGYFATGVDEKPLLHTWSLSVEEQFYIFFPILLWFCFRYARAYLVPVLLVVALGSLALSEIFWRIAPTPNFYLLPTRTWELAAGSLCAVIGKRSSNSLSAGLGLLLILAAIFLFDEHTPVPSLYMLVPVAGVVLIILYADAENLVGRVLSVKPMVGLGLISYSAYLWHQPLFALARAYMVEHPPLSLMLALSALSLLLAWATWKLVENPFRKRGAKIGFSRNQIFAFSGVGLAAMVVIGVIGQAVTHDVEREATYGNCNGDRSDCFVRPNAPIKVALWGDSFADAFALSLGGAVNQADASLTLYIKHSCPSLLGVERNEDRRMGANFRTDCVKQNVEALEQIKTTRPDFVVLTSSYGFYANGKNDEGEPILVDKASVGGTPIVAEALQSTVAALQATGTKVIVVTPHPTVPDFWSQRKAVARGWADNITIDTQPTADFGTQLMAPLRASVEKPYEIDGLATLCADAKEGVCEIIDPAGNLKLADDGHVSPYTAKKIAGEVMQIVGNRR